MKNSEISIRERLISKDLVGFDTRGGVVRAPSAKVGASEGGPPIARGEIKPSA